MEREVRSKSILKYLLVAVVVAAITVLIMTLIPKGRDVNILEKNAINAYSDKVMAHMEEIDFDTSNVDNNSSSNPIYNGFPLDRYIAYSLEYYSDFENKNELTAKEIKDFLSSTFDINVEEDTINGVGVSPLLLDKHISHEPVGKTYSIKHETNKRAIADIAISKYIQQGDITVNSDSTIYTVIYNKYTAKSPYDVLPHAEGGNAGVNDYLNGKGKISSIKALITSDNAESITGAEKQTTIEYTIKDDHLSIKSIK